MGDGAISTVCLVAVILVGILASCRFLGLYTWVTAWIFSNREEKAVLTRLKGHYNANGYLVDSDSEITLGTFKRFDCVDRDLSKCPILTQNLIDPNISPTTPTPLALTEVNEDEQLLEKTVQNLQRAVSCDSVCSDDSVGVTGLPEPNFTGYLCIGIEYDSEIADLMVTVIEAKDLSCTDVNYTSSPLSTYVRVYLMPNKTSNMQTRVYRKSNSPTYKEKFMFALEQCDYISRSLTFYVFATDKQSNSLIGEAELHLSDVPARQPITTWLTLTDTGQRSSAVGEVLFSLSYLPTAERLTVVIVKARNLVFPSGTNSEDPFVKVYLMQQGKKVQKKKTTSKKGEKSPIFNEAIIFSVPIHTLQVHIELYECWKFLPDNTTASLCGCSQMFQGISWWERSCDRPCGYGERIIWQGTSPLESDAYFSAQTHCYVAFSAYKVDNKGSTLITIFNDTFPGMLQGVASLLCLFMHLLFLFK